MTEKKLTLYGISDEIEIIEALIEKLGGEVSDETEDALVTIEKMIVEKADSYIGVMNKKKDLIKLIAERRKDLQAAENSLKKDIDRMNQTCIDFMERTGRSEIKGQLEIIKPRKAAVKLDIEDINKVPMEFTVIIPERLDTKNDEIKKALKNGEIVGGCKLVEGKRSISVSRRKV